MNFLTHANSPQPKPLPENTETSTPILIAQGTYGCVYYPGFTCKGTPQSTKYITKLQKNNETLKNELEIGNKIQKIKNYPYYFAPILKQCPVSLSTLQNNYSQPLKKCKVIKTEEKAKDFNINKIRYILGEDLGKTFKQKNTTQSIEIIPFMLDSYDYLCKSLKKLKKQNIYHYDLKSNNIIYDKESYIPIIIDFGLSIDLDTITPTTPDPLLLNKYFFDVYEYDYWCLEPILIGYYASYYRDFAEENQFDKKSTESKAKYNQTKISEELLEVFQTVLNKYISYAYVFKPEFQTKLSQIFPTTSPIQKIIETFTKTFHEKWHKYVEDNKSETCLQFFQTLWKSRFTWDYYSLAVIYIDFISELPPLPPDDPQNPILEAFTTMLLNQILALPKEREET